MNNTETEWYRLIDGFRFFSTPLMKKYIFVEKSRINEYCDYINKAKIVDVYLNENIDVIDFVVRCSKIENLIIQSPTIKDFSPLYSLKNLKRLSLDIPDGKIDLARIPSLEKFGAYKYKNILNLDKSRNLKKLGLMHYNPESKDLSEIANLENLIELGILRSNINSFKGIGNFKLLKRFELTYSSNLYCLDELEKLSDNLSTLRFDSCKKIQNHEYVANLKNLKLLSFDGCGDISSIGFIKQMPNLKAFIFLIPMWLMVTYRLV